jgi:hypothetical protein
MARLNYGYYGGFNVRFIDKPRFSKGYEQRICCLCDGKALWHQDGQGYCEFHKAAAVAAMQKKSESYVTRIIRTTCSNELEDLR